MLLRGYKAFDSLTDEHSQVLVKTGSRPTIYLDILYDNHPIMQVLRDAMVMCYEHDPAVRASAREVEAFLMGKMRELDSGFLETLGQSR
jgi:hypothetical protein